MSTSGYLVVVHGGVYYDKSWKDPGSLDQYGPYADKAYADAVAFLNEDEGTDWTTPRWAEVIDLSEEGEPYDLREHLTDTSEGLELDEMLALPAERQAAYDAIDPAWRDMLREIYAESEEVGQP